MCLGMNPDMLTPGQRCASTSNRNFEGRQGPGGRTHLVSPAMAAAAAIAGHLVDARKLGLGEPLDDFTVVPRVAVEAITQDREPIEAAEEVQAADAVGDAVSVSPGAGNGGGGSTMPAFTVVRGIAAPLERANVDTDLIIPAR